MPSDSVLSAFGRLSRTMPRPPRRSKRISSKVTARPGARRRTWPMDDRKTPPPLQRVVQKKRPAEAGQSGLSESATLWLRDMPSAVGVAVTGGVAGLGVTRPAVKRMAFICPLLGTVGARHDDPIAGRRRSRGCHQRRPIAGAGAVAVRLGRRVLGEGVERHLLAVDQHRTFSRIG